MDTSAQWQETLLFAVALTGTVGVWTVARRGRAAAAVVLYSLPRLVVTVAGAAVEVDDVDAFAAAAALALVFAFLGGMLAVYGAYVWCNILGKESREVVACRNGWMINVALRRKEGSST